MGKKEKNIKLAYFFLIAGIFIIFFEIICFMLHKNLTLSGRLIFPAVSCIFVYIGCFLIIRVYTEQKEAVRKILITVCTLNYFLVLITTLFAYNSFGRGFRCFFTASAEYRTVYIYNCINFIPGRTIFSYLQLKTNLFYTLINLLGNLAVLMPCAILLPNIFTSLRKMMRYSIVIVMLAIVIEIIQLLFMCGSVDIDDVILNSLGSIGLYFIIYHSRLNNFIEKIFWVK